MTFLLKRDIFKKGKKKRALLLENKELFFNLF